jgi:coenzyme F420-reducing hydrogenase beta subunit
MAALDRRVAERLDVTIGLFCHSCLDHAALRDLLAVYRMGERDLSRVIYRHTKLPGYVRAQTRAGNWLDLPYPHAPSGSYRPDAKECLTLLFKFYSPERCRLCLDSMAEFGDIAIGDPWIAGWPAIPKLYAGYNMVFARTEKGLRLLEEARDAGVIALEPFDAACVPTNHQPMVRNKRLRALYRIERRKRRGHAWPDYGVDRRLTFGERIHVILHVATYWFADKPAARRRILRALLSRPGRWLVGLIFLRRRYFGRRWARLRARAQLERAVQ